MKLSWSIYNNDYLTIQFVRQLKRGRVSRGLVAELQRRGLLTTIINLLPKEMRQQLEDVLQFVYNVAIASAIKDSLGTKWRFPEKLSKYPIIIADYLRRGNEFVIDRFEDSQYVYEIRLDCDGLRVVPMWKL